MLAFGREITSHGRNVLLGKLKGFNMLAANTLKTIDLVHLTLKEAMGYKDGSTCCGSCRHFVPDDCSGNSGAKHKHCSRNAIELPVVESGWCREFTPK